MTFIRYTVVREEDGLWYGRVIARGHVIREFAHESKVEVLRQVGVALRGFWGPS